LVVSVEISGMLEDKLRRLVELGIYASVSEAVRDAIRRMLSNMDLMRISADIYTKKGCSLYYACYFSETTCQKFIDYLLINGITPGLGTVDDPPLPGKSEKFVLDPSSIYVIFNTMLVNVFNKLKLNQSFYIPETLSTFFQLNLAYALRRGIDVSYEVKYFKIKEINVPNNLYLTKVEYALLNTLKRGNITLVSDDFYVQNISKNMGITVMPSISFLKHARINKLLNDIEYREILMSLKGLPYIYPHTLDEL
jgi:hypothetical protein